MARTARGVKTFDVDIAQEFKNLYDQNDVLKQELNAQNIELRKEIQSLKESINDWKSGFDKQLDKLNDNMSKVLNQIADHELRLSELERQRLINSTKVETASELAKFGWYAGKVVLTVDMVIGSALGGAKVWQMMFQ